MAADRKKEAIKALNDLISTCRDSQEGFGKAAKGVHSDALRERFTEIAGKRADFADEIAREVRRLGGEPAAMPHGGGILHRGWVDLETRIRPKEDESFLRECARGQESAIPHYQHALAQDLAGETRDLVERQMQDIQATIAELRGEQARRAG
jgi:uncharacterized protein (TIGR02284 family)